MRNLVIVLGDQLDRESSAFDGFNPDSDIVWMAEAEEESTHVWTVKPRIAIFLAAMRHFRDELCERGIEVDYTSLDSRSQTDGLGAMLGRAIRRLKPNAIIVTEPGEYRLWEALERVCEDNGVDLEIRSDRHFFGTVEDFREWAEGRKALRMEYFYREMRKRHAILMTEHGEPEGGSWNFDAENRKSFGKEGPGNLPEGIRHRPDDCTRDVIDLVNDRFADHPGSLEAFGWPVTRKQALADLRDFVENRLPNFGDFQDAMWMDEPFLYHSRLGAALNLKLLNPREVVAAAEKAYRGGHAPLAAVEGFIRQILGWREYVRGVYWRHMPEYLERNELSATADLPGFFWTGKTNCECLRQVISQTLKFGYAHHIQRLMVTGLYAMLLGVDPKQVHEWYLAVYVDAVEWVELPNVLGMSQYADGGVMGSKPYAATGKYIDRMSNYCKSCAFNPKEAEGDSACPFTTLYWDFLIRHEKKLTANQRMSLQVRNVGRLSDERRQAILTRAKQIKKDPAMMNDLAPMALGL